MFITFLQEITRLIVIAGLIFGASYIVLLEKHTHQSKFIQKILTKFHFRIEALEHRSKGVYSF